ncbi:MAG: sigma-70 family RNA polymerase sigma factor [Acidobacteriota bacterium]
MTLQRFEFDAAYLDRLIAGDPEVERHFTSYFGDLIMLKLRSRLRSPALVEDVKQETFLRVIRTLREKGVASAPSLGAFVNSVCNNVLFETYRAQSKARLAEPEPLEVLESPAESVETALVDQSEHARVRRALAELPARDQQLIRWLFFEEQPKDEICRRLGIDRQYLRVMLHRVKGRFRDVLDRIAADQAPETARPAPSP